MSIGRIWRDNVSRNGLKELTSDLPARLQLEMLRDFDAGTLQDNAGMQWKVVQSPVVMTEGKKPKPRQTSGKISLERRKYDDLTLDEKFDETVRTIRAYRSVIAQDKLSDAQILERLQSQPNTQARNELRQALDESANKSQVLSQGPGQVGSHGKSFKGTIPLENATQFLYDSHDRLSGGLFGLAQQGHSLAKSQYPDQARDIKLMRAQQGEVNWYDGDGQYVNMTRVENLQNGRRMAFDRLCDLMDEYELTGASPEKLERVRTIGLSLLGF